MYGAPRDGALIYVSCPTIAQERRGVERVCPVQKECGCRVSGRCRLRTGYELGAEDYVTKPFPMSVFQKKLSVALGRLAKQSGGDCYEDGALSINFSEMTASLSGKALVFTPLEYRLLKILTKNPQNVLTRQVLLEKLWDADGNFVDEHALTSAISRVRNKIETEGRQYIKTVYGMGYMWIGGAPK